MKNNFVPFFISIFLICILISNVAHTQVLLNPVNANSGSPFGPRFHPIHKEMRDHNGKDFPAPIGTPIYAANSGTLSFKPNNGSAGNMAIVQGQYVRTVYMHANSLIGQNGSKIAAGTNMATVGTTGGSTGPHLHYETHVQDPSTGEWVKVDPDDLEGKDVSDPAVREEAIKKAEEKMGKKPVAPDDYTSQAAQQGGGGGNGQLIGCDPAIKEGATAKVDALKQQETEAAKALITKPASVQQLTCFDQYTKVNADKIGKIHSDPEKGISDTIVPNVEVPAMQNVIQNFMTNVLGGGLQSMLNGAMGQITGALGMGGGAGGAGTCGAMDEMWKLLQCMDFPKMPSLSDIMGGGGGGAGDMLSGALSGLGGAGGLGSLGSGGGGGGLMGAVCQAMKGAMGGGGSGGTDVYEKALEEANKPVEQNDLSAGAEDLQNKIADTVSGKNLCTKDTWKYPQNTLSRIDVLVVDGEIDASEFTLFDTDGSCEITEAEIQTYEGTSPAIGAQ